MPIEVRRLKEEKEAYPSITPDTNAFKILRILFDEPELAFSPKEIADLTDVNRGSVSKTLSRLEDKDLVEHYDTYWTAADDEGVSEYIASLHSLDAMKDDPQFEDQYAEDTGWDEELPDLGPDEP